MKNKKKYVVCLFVSVAFLLLGLIFFFVGNTKNTNISYEILKTTSRLQFSTSAQQNRQYIYMDMYVYNNTSETVKDVTLQFTYKTTQKNVKTTEMTFSKLQQGQNYVSNEKFDYINLTNFYDTEKFGEIVSVKYRIGETEFVNAKEHESVSFLRAASYLIFAGAGLCTAVFLILVVNKDPHPKNTLPSSVIIVNAQPEAPKNNVDKQKELELERENLKLKTEINSLKTKMVVCSYCGKKTPTDADACKHCGAPIK